MLTRITLTFKQEEKEALQKLAEREHRDPRVMGSLIIKKELIMSGLLSFQDPKEENKVVLGDCNG